MEYKAFQGRNVVVRYIQPSQIAGHKENGEEIWIDEVSEVETSEGWRTWVHSTELEPIDEPTE